jgi:hypothetical protein
MLYNLLIILLILALLGVLPAWPYSSTWGYYPSGLLTIVVLILVAMMVTGYV